MYYHYIFCSLISLLSCIFPLYSNAEDNCISLATFTSLETKSASDIRLALEKEKWKYIALTALFGTFLPAYLFALAETQVSSSICSILNSLTPLNTLWIGVLAFHFVIKPRQILGVLIGLAGTIALILGGNQTANSQNISFSLFVIIASICYAININLIKKYLHDLKPLSISTGNFTVMFLPALLILFCTDFTQKIYTETTQTALFYIIILGVTS